MLEDEFEKDEPVVRLSLQSEKKTCALVAKWACGPWTLHWKFIHKFTIMLMNYDNGDLCH
jgi:hypothetical protein